MARFDGDLGVGSLLSHYGEDTHYEGAVVPPIFQTSLFVFPTAEELLAAMGQRPDESPHHYSRLSNPTLDLAEQKIARLEGTEACKVTGCGMAAISNVILSCVESGSHVVVPDTVYGPVRSLLSGYLDRFGVAVTYVTGTDVAEVLDAIRPETTLIYLESPSSLLFRMQDVAAICREAKARGITTAIDNTYNTPIHFRPAELGIDLVCHSATKYLGGHSDLTAGAICGSRERIHRITIREINLLGNVLHPHPAWLLTRGLRTLEVRLKRHESTANQIAAWLEGQTWVEKVHHIGLDSYEQRALFRSMMSGSGGLFSIEPKVQDRERIMAFCNRLQLFQRGISWGGFESLVVPLHVKPLDFPEARWLVRFYCGLEEPGDLVNDLLAASVELA